MTSNEPVDDTLEDRWNAYLDHVAEYEMRDGFPDDFHVPVECAVEEWDTAAFRERSEMVLADVDEMMLEEIQELEEKRERLKEFTANLLDDDYW